MYGTFEEKPVMNPIIRHTFTADPTAIVHNEKVYLFTGHDEADAEATEYTMKRWMCFSSDDMEAWTEHPSPIRATDFKWASGDAFASKIVFHNSRFYFLTSVSHGAKPGKAIGVAVSDTPTGPFTDAIGEALVTHDMLPSAESEMANLDPTVLIDDDGRAYLFWGNGQCYFAKLNSGFTAIESHIQVIDLPKFTEGAHIHKRNGWYYLSYGYGMPEKVAYAMSRSISGPWKFRGILNEIAGNCQTNRPAVITFKGREYFFYHNGALPGGNSYRRSVCVDYLNYNDDGTMQRIVMTSEGVERV